MYSYDRVTVTGELTTDEHYRWLVIVTEESPRHGDDFECANCGSALDMQTWTPTVVVERDDEPPEIRRFCDDECREAWREEG